MIGYFEGLGSERGMDGRVADSRTLRRFLGYALTETTPDHSSRSRLRQRLPLEVHQAVFNWVLKVLAQEGLLTGKTVAVDATTLEANAALRRIVRWDTGEGSHEYLKGLAPAEGIETPTRQDVAKLDRKRVHKAEHTIGLDTQALVAIQVGGADEGPGVRPCNGFALSIRNAVSPTRMKRGTCDVRTCVAMKRSTNAGVFMAAPSIWGW